VRKEDGQYCAENEQYASKIGRRLLEDIRRLRAGEGVHHAATESGTETFLPRALHEDDEGEEEANEHLENREETNEKVHGGREYGTGMGDGKLQTPNSKFQIPRNTHPFSPQRGFAAFHRIRCLLSVES
jgi:hypothetical protein